MNYNETGTGKMHTIAHPRVFRGTANAPLSQSSPETQASYRSTIPLQVQSHRTSLILGILPLLRANAGLHPHP